MAKARGPLFLRCGFHQLAGTNPELSGWGAVKAMLLGVCQTEELGRV